MLNAKADKIDCGEWVITTASNDTIWFWEDGREDASTAAHSGDLGIIVAFLVVLDIEWSIDEGEIREETLGGDFHTALEEVVVWIFWIVIDALFYLKNWDWEDWCLAATKTSFSSFEKHLGNETTWFGGIGAKINRSEWNLGASTGVHGV